MFGISGGEFLVILLVAIAILPARMWPDVARFLARAIREIRQFMWRISDASEQIKNQIEREAPIDEIINVTTHNVLDDFSSPRPRSKKTKTGASRQGRGRGKK